MFELTPFNNSFTNDLLTFNNMIDDFFNNRYLSSKNIRNDTFKIDVKESEKEYLVEAELPGIKKDEMKIYYEERRMMIVVKRVVQANEEKENYVHRERRITSMQRSIYLGDINVGAIEAKLEDGILKIKAPKKEKIDNRLQIEVK
ncbi:Hsp20 family protein [Abyssisolibacter fermentans]|uniref:Hsp20 family protein n=1 Tax=Abyssisolibacter fermentans TaxID=1766203 RepID=UPI0008379C62|nr:Hsp20 family protein [Abyssisolibacter fermentans]